MSTVQPAIEVKNLGKVYRINHEQQATVGNSTFRDALVGIIAKPLRAVMGKKTNAEQFWALKDVNFNVMPGEVVGIIGSNGSGKSTLLKVLSRIVDPATGQVIMRGKVASLLEVGTGFHPELTGRENIFFNGAILGMSQKEIKEKFDEIVAFSEVEQFLDTPVKFYSSGMYVRLAFAVAAHLEPDILIVDEVLAVGDAAFQKKCLGKMQDVANQGRTVLFVSHSMPSIKALCKTAIWLNKGKIAAQGDIEDVADLYQKSYESALVSDLRKRARPKTASLEAQIVKVEVEEADNPKTSLIDSTKPMKIRFEIEATKALDDIYLHCGLNNANQMVLRFMSEHTSTRFKLNKGHNVVECLVNPTHLAGGTYTLDCSILFPGREQLGHIDEVPEATLFTINELQIPAGDAYLTDREAVYFVEHSWQHTKKG